MFDFGHYLTNKINIKGKKFIPVFLHFLVVLTIFILMFVFKDGDFKVLGIKLTGYYAIFYSFGYVFNLYIKSVFSTSKKGVILNYVILSLSLVILLFEVFYFESIYDFDDTNIKYILIRLIGSASAIIVNIFLFDYLAKFKIFNKISSLGRFSLESYYLHVIFLRYINFSVLTPGMAWLMTFTISILLATLVALTLMFMYYIPYLHLILFGRSLSVYQFEKKLPKILR